MFMQRKPLHILGSREQAVYEGNQIMGPNVFS